MHKIGNISNPLFILRQQNNSGQLFWSSLCITLAFSARLFLNLWPSPSLIPPFFPASYCILTPFPPTTGINHQHIPHVRHPVTYFALYPLDKESDRTPPRPDRHITQQLVRLKGSWAKVEKMNTFLLSSAFLYRSSSLMWWLPWHLFIMEC